MGNEKLAEHATITEEIQGMVRDRLINSKQKDQGGKKKMAGMLS